MLGYSFTLCLQDPVRRCLFSRSSLSFFALNGLHKLHGESVTIAKKELVAVCKRLDAARDLPEDAPLDIIKGL